MLALPMGLLMRLLFLPLVQWCFDDTLRSVNPRRHIAPPNGIGLDSLKKLKFTSVGGAPMKVSVAQELLAQNIRILNHWGAYPFCSAYRLKPDISPQTRRKLATSLPSALPRTTIGSHRAQTLVFDSDQRRMAKRFASLGDRLYGPRTLSCKTYFCHTPQSRIDSVSLGERTICSYSPQARKYVQDHWSAPSIRASRLLWRSEAVESLWASWSSLSMEYASRNLWTFLEKGNATMDGHGRVEKDMVVFTFMPMLRTDKGSLQVKAMLALFKDEIARAYECVGRGDRQLVWNSREILHGMVADVSRLEGYHSGQMDGVDFFEAEMDTSLQASRLCRANSAGLRLTPNAPDNAVVESDLCFRSPTVDKLFVAVNRPLSGQGDVRVH